MGHDLATAGEALLAIPTSPFTEKSLASLRRAMGRTNGRPMLMGGHSITSMGQQKIRDRLSSFRLRLTAGQADRPLVAGELAKLLGAFPTQDASISAPIRIDAYRDAIGDAPAWAVREARLRIIRGEAMGLDKRFAPTPPQLVTVIDEIMRPLRNDLSDLESLAEVVPSPGDGPEVHTRVVEGFAKLRGDLKREPDPQTSFNASWSDLERRAQANGHDPKSAMDAVPDNRKTGTFQNLADIPIATPAKDIP